MNAKKAKQLRREANYHPSDRREFQVMNKSRKVKTRRTKIGGKYMDVPTPEAKTGTIELHESCSRVLYQELKKEFYNNN